MSTSGRIHFAHFVQGMPAIAKPAIKVVAVGKIIFPIPSAKEKVNTAVWRVISNMSASGTIIGMVSIAWPVPDAKMK